MRVISNQQEEPNHVKIAFQLQKDEGDYPPVAVETMWALPLDEADLYWLDNTPIFAKGVSSEDTVRATKIGGRLEFQDVVHSSGNSVVRIIVSDIDSVASVRETCEQLMCSWEQSYIPRLFAIEIPRVTDITLVAAFLDEGVLEGSWDYEVGVMRHAVSTDLLGKAL